MEQSTWNPNVFIFWQCRERKHYSYKSVQLLEDVKDKKQEPSNQILNQNKIMLVQFWKSYKDPKWLYSFQKNSVSEQVDDDDDDDTGSCLSTSSKHS